MEGISPSLMVTTREDEQVYMCSISIFPPRARQQTRTCASQFHIVYYSILNQLSFPVLPHENRSLAAYFSQEFNVHCSIE